jgi:hypothetical protein
MEFQSVMAIDFIFAHFGRVEPQVSQPNRSDLINYPFKTYQRPGRTAEIA